ncbi:SDR family NAD(P)-dependent oxidoreductase [Nakamurella sp. YIM 132087]|uniref:SDR family NAD(P)-dependent oxidoreductase n=1 Tax=Nakamurella alba TaxID=2665158 RepID=A0A7K1FT27_9ACTN|nr:SDR family oxidoreductase [Nakamurella alba]MTD17240.1 SDR family NAD(P)-dependent oxidoreductase [Nakamurella alba]
MSDRAAAGWFDGQVALVTGGGSGMGAATVRRLVREGCRAVVAVDLSAEGLRHTAEFSEVIDTAVVDISDPAAVDGVFAEALGKHGQIDVVVHAAGIDDPFAKAEILSAAEEKRPVLVTDKVTDEMWRKILAVNLDGTFYVLRAAARAMIPRRSGAIVTIGSSAAFDTFAGYAAYAASKAGVQAMSQSVAKELAHFGIRVNTVAPGPVDTAMAARTPASVREVLAASGARGYASPDELADTIVYLASPGAVNVIGAVVLSNGGRFTA